MDKKIECVITRYNEHLNWINYLPDEIEKITIVNKGSNEFIFQNMDCKYNNKLTIHKSDNIGRHNETIAKYIVDNYDNLPDTVLFIPGTVMMNPKKGLYLAQLCKHMKNIDSFRGFFSPRFRKVGRNYNYSVKEYLSTSQCNANDSEFIRSDIGTFNDWKKVIIAGDDQPVKYICYRGIFAVNRDNILKHSKELYISILNSISGGENTENSQFAERIWAHLFKSEYLNQSV
jgi:hypothetical protein